MDGDSPAELCYGYGSGALDQARGARDRVPEIPYSESGNQIQDYGSTLEWLEGEIASLPTNDELFQRTVARIHSELSTYNWVGFYMLDPADASMLVLGPFAGAATPHTRIPVSEGICGAAVAQGKTVVVDDVKSDPRYLSCSIETKSEIVVPIRVRGEIVGEIDIDSHTPAAFGEDDRVFVERCAELIGGYLEASPKG